MIPKRVRGELDPEKAAGTDVSLNQSEDKPGNGPEAPKSVTDAGGGGRQRVPESPMWTIRRREDVYGVLGYNLSERNSV